MAKILVDTSIIIDFLRRKDKQNSLFYQVFSKDSHTPLISLITITELWAGKSIGQAGVLKFIEELIVKCEIISPNLKTAKLAGKILRQTNYQVSFQDAIISAQALEEKLTILTLNEKDFKKIKGIKIFRQPFK